MSDTSESDGNTTTEESTTNPSMPPSQDVLDAIQAAVSGMAIEIKNQRESDRKLTYRTSELTWYGIGNYDYFKFTLEQYARDIGASQCLTPDPNNPNQPVMGESILPSEAESKTVSDGPRPQDTRPATPEELQNYKANNALTTALLNCLPINLAATVQQAAGNRNMAFNIIKELDSQFEQTGDIGNLPDLKRMRDNLDPETFRDAPKYWAAFERLNSLVAKLHPASGYDDLLKKLEIRKAIQDKVPASNPSDFAWTPWLQTYLQQNKIQTEPLAEFRANYYQTWLAVGRPVGRSRERAFYTGTRPPNNRGRPLTRPPRPAPPRPMSFNNRFNGPQLARRSYQNRGNPNLSRPSTPVRPNLSPNFNFNNNNRPRRPFGDSNRPRYNNNNGQRCHICNSLDHFASNCPRQALMPARRFGNNNRQSPSFGNRLQNRFQGGRNGSNRRPPGARNINGNRNPSNRRREQIFMLSEVKHKAKPQGLHDSKHTFVANKPQVPIAPTKPPLVIELFTSSDDDDSIADDVSAITGPDFKETPKPYAALPLKKRPHESTNALSQADPNKTLKRHANKGPSSESAYYTPTRKDMPSPSMFTPTKEEESESTLNLYKFLLQSSLLECDGDEQSAHTQVMEHLYDRNYREGDRLRLEWENLNLEGGPESEFTLQDIEMVDAMFAEQVEPFPDNPKQELVDEARKACIKSRLIENKSLDHLMECIHYAEQTIKHKNKPPKEQVLMTRNDSHSNQEDQTGEHVQQPQDSPLSNHQQRFLDRMDTQASYHIPDDNGGRRQVNLLEAIRWFVNAERYGPRLYEEHHYPPYYFTGPNDFNAITGADSPPELDIWLRDYKRLRCHDWRQQMILCHFHRFPIESIENTFNLHLARLYNQTELDHPVLYPDEHEFNPPPWVELQRPFEDYKQMWSKWREAEAKDSIKRLDDLLREQRTTPVLDPARRDEITYECAEHLAKASGSEGKPTETHLKIAAALPSSHPILPKPVPVKSTVVAPSSKLKRSKTIQSPPTPSQTSNTKLKPAPPAYNHPLPSSLPQAQSKPPMPLKSILKNPIKTGPTSPLQHQTPTKDTGRSIDSAHYFGSSSDMSLSNESTVTKPSTPPAKMDESIEPGVSYIYSKQVGDTTHQFSSLECMRLWEQGILNEGHVLYPCDGHTHTIRHIYDPVDDNIKASNYGRPPKGLKANSAYKLQHTSTYRTPAGNTTFDDKFNTADSACRPYSPSDPSYSSNDSTGTPFDIALANATDNRNNAHHIESALHQHCPDTTNGNLKEQTTNQMQSSFRELQTNIGLHNHVKLNEYQQILKANFGHSRVPPSTIPTLSHPNHFPDQCSSSESILVRVRDL